MSKASRGTPDGFMRTGDLAIATSTTPRMLRHYENEGLISARRSSSGQRLFDIGVIMQVRAIWRLLDAGLPVAAIRELLDCVHDTNRLDPCAVPVLVEHLRSYDDRIVELTTTRDALQGPIDSSHS